MIGILTLSWGKLACTIIRLAVVMAVARSNKGAEGQRMGRVPDVVDDMTC